MTVLPILIATLWTRFSAPVPEARPWCYYWWINGHADRATITLDLEDMQKLGFGGILLFDSRGYWDDADHVVNPKAELIWGSPEWHDLVAHTIRECARLGLVFTMNASASGGWLNGFRGGCEYQVDVMDPKAVREHLDFALGPVLARVGEHVGKTFTHVYSVSYEGKLRSGATWRQIKDNFYGTMAMWAKEHGLKIFSESGGPWCDEAAKALVDCDQLDILAFNDFPQGEFWPVHEKFTVPETGHANVNARYFSRAAVLAARRQGRPIVSLEAFTHMHRHWSVDPAFLKPLADMAYADGVNRLVWHTYTCSPARFGVPGAEYFAGSHINRNVTWHDDAAAFVGYLGRCQSLLQFGSYVDDGEFASVSTNYFGWGRYRVGGDVPYTATHRRAGKTDYWFVAGEGRLALNLPTGLSGRAAEIWDPVAVVRHPAKVVRAEAERTEIALELPKAGSCFVVMTADDEQPLCQSEDDRMSHPFDVHGPWHVSFAYPVGIVAPPPREMRFSELKDFREFATLKHFAGYATYRVRFSCTESEAGFSCLSLGELPSGVARVSVNGVDCGVVWCAPWETSVAGALRPGENELEVRYTNNWYNRLVGDCFLDESNRVTRSTLHYWTVPRRGDSSNFWTLNPTVYSGPSVSDPLQPSGLLGPVRLLKGRE